MAHTPYYYEFGDHMEDGTPDTRYRTMPARALNRGHDALVDGAIGVIDGARAVKDFAGNMTYNPLPYGEYARSAYDGMQNLYGNALDNGMNSVIDFVNPQPDMMSGGPMSRGPAYQRYVARNGWYNDDRYINHPDNADQLATRNYEDNYVYTEAEMGSSPVQETDTGPGLMMSGGPMSRGGNNARQVTNSMFPNPTYNAIGSHWYQDYDDAKTQAMLNLRPNPIEQGPAGQSRRGFGENTARFVTRPIAQKYLDINDGTPMSYNDFDKYIGVQQNPTTEKPQSPQSDWAKWKASRKPQER